MLPKLETITPKKAEKLLEGNTFNRRLREGHVLWLAQQIENDDWAETGESIKIASDGTIIDGQHRLHAIILANKSIRTLVCYNVPKSAQPLVDTGKTRTPADVLSMHGITNPMRVAAAIRTIINTGEIPVDEADYASFSKRKIPHAVVLRFAQEHNEALQEAVTALREADGPSLCRPPSTFVATYFILHQKNARKCREFFELVCSGEDTAENSPIKRLRSVLMHELANTNRRRTRHKLWYIGLTAKAWNAWLRGDEIRRLTFNDNENWPRIRARG
jgi:hypothetical protein